MSNTRRVIVLHDYAGVAAALTRRFKRVFDENLSAIVDDAATIVGQQIGGDLDNALAAAQAAQMQAEQLATTVEGYVADLNPATVMNRGDFGVALPGAVSGPLLATTGATDTPAGIYRYDTTTTGAFPSGVSPAIGGIIEVVREGPSLLMQRLTPRGSRSTYLRYYSAGAWSVWAKLYGEEDRATESEATSGTSTSRVMTPLRVWQAIAGERATRQGETAPVTTSGATSYQITGLPAGVTCARVWFTDLQLSAAGTVHLLPLDPGGAAPTSNMTTNTFTTSSSPNTTHSTVGLALNDTASGNAVAGAKRSGYVDVQIQNGDVHVHGSILVDGAAVYHAECRGRAGTMAALGGCELRASAGTFAAGSFQVEWRK